MVIDLEAEGFGGSYMQLGDLQLTCDPWKIHNHCGLWYTREVFGSDVAKIMISLRYFCTNID